MVVRNRLDEPYTQWRLRRLLKRSINALNTFRAISLLRECFGRFHWVIRNRLFELCAMVQTARSAPICPTLSGKEECQNFSCGASLARPNDFLLISLFLARYARPNRPQYVTFPD